MSAQILIVEDESAIADTIIYALKSEGFHTTWVSLGHDAVAKLAQSKPNLIVLDVGLPDISGFEVCKKIRLISQVPIIFLTARNDEVDRIVGLEIGADDYVAKPFSPRELVARVKAILKRTTFVSAAMPSANGWFVIDEAKARVTFCGHILDLTRYEYLLAKTMLCEPERVFSRAQLMDLVWASEASMERTVDAHIKSLRAKLRAANADVEPIETHRGLGYSMSNHAS